ncbi:MAG: glycoside hydrolase family 2 TIM barrel-domain containing protein [Bacillota bacterium]
MQVMETGNYKLNDNWKFKKGDPEGAQKLNFDDSDWQLVNLPHDWSIKGDFSAEYASSTGYLPGGIGWYRRELDISEDLSDRKIIIRFDGIYRNAEIYINGKKVGYRPYGYISHHYNITPYLNSGNKKNILAVRVDHREVADSRWYTGSGIYRNVFLKITNRLSLKQYGTFITTPEITSDKAVVRIINYLENCQEKEKEVQVLNIIKDNQGNVVCSRESVISVKKDGDKKITGEMEVINPHLWSPEDPYLYRLETRIKENDRILDSSLTPFGIRHFKFDADQGFFLNGKKMKMKGVCVHHDAGCLGAAVPKNVWRRRLRLLKEMGCNALRMSHNPPAPELLDLCDEMGFLVQDEAFDEWEYPKNKWVEGWNKGKPAHHGYAEYFDEWAEMDLRNMILRDRNHPSIVFWSIGNEIDYPNDPYSHEVLEEDYDYEQPDAKSMGPIARNLVNTVKEYDNTRPVTAALACVQMSNQTDFVKVLDVVGYNYQEDRYQKDKNEFPARVIYGSENKSSFSAWQAVAENEFISGQFLWTGIDYLGEARSWPARSSRSGLLDLAGFKKPEYYYRKSLWSKKPVLKLFSLPRDKVDQEGNFNWDRDVKPHWNWEDRQGEIIRILCCTNYSVVELFINGESRGIKKLTEAKRNLIHWDLPYESGNIEVRPLEPSVVKDRAVLQTYGKPSQLKVTSDRQRLPADGETVAHVRIDVLDQKGIPVYESEHPVSCEVEGPGQLLGLENGNHKSHQNYGKKKRKVYRGRLMAYLQAGKKEGEITFKTQAKGLSSGQVRIKI